MIKGMYIAWGIIGIVFFISVVAYYLYDYNAPLGAVKINQLNQIINTEQTFQASEFQAKGRYTQKLRSTDGQFTYETHVFDGPEGKGYKYYIYENRAGVDWVASVKVYEDGRTIVEDFKPKPIPVQTP